MAAPWWWWALAALLVATLTAAQIDLASKQAGIVFAVATTLGAVALLAGYTLRIRIDGDTLIVGRNRLERRYVADAHPFDGEQARRITGPEADRTAFLQTRPYAHGIVRVTLDDPADPHGCWLISTRRPEELAQAVRRMA